MANNADQDRQRMTWGECGEALARLQDSLFIDRDLWVLGNMGRHSLRATGDGSR